MYVDDILFQCASDMVRCEEQAHSTAADEDADDLSPLVAHAENEERDQNDADDGPEVEKLSLYSLAVDVHSNINRGFLPIEGWCIDMPTQ